MPPENQQPKYESVRYGNCEVKIYDRGDGKKLVAWREGGQKKRVTRTDPEKAVQFAKDKARQLDRTTGQRIISPIRAERLEWLEKIAGGESSTSPLLHALEQSVKVLGGYGALVEAARYYKTHGPASVRAITVGEAAAAILTEYKTSAPDTYVEMRQELGTFTKLHPDMPLLDITREVIEEHIRKDHLAPRTVKNRIRRWTTFFNRCRELEYWPEERKNPTAAIKKPRTDDKAPPIFTPTQGEKLLKLVIAEKRPFLPYLLIAGWLSCRPSECLRLRKSNFDFEHRQLHLPPSVVGKTRRERWVEIPETLCQILQQLFAEETHGKITKHGKICRHLSRDEISAISREHGLGWEPDILRHSSITYRLQVVKNIDEVAEESGNSPKIIRDSYRRPIPPGWGEKWAALLEKARDLICSPAGQDAA